MRKLKRNINRTISRPKVVFIDWNGTLSPPNFWVHMEQSSIERQRNLFKIWAEAMFIKHKEKIVPWMKGMYKTEEMLEMVSRETRTDYYSLLNEFIIGCQNMQFFSSKIPNLVNKIRKKNVIVTIATDNMDCFNRWTVPALRLNTLFDEILNSFYLKAMKYDLDEDGGSLFFKNFFNDYGVNPSDTVLLDDGEKKIEVITNLGIEYRRITLENPLEKELTKILQSL